MFRSELSDHFLKVGIIIPVLSEGNRGIESCTELPMLTQQVSGKTGKDACLYIRVHGKMLTHIPFFLSMSITEPPNSCHGISILVLMESHAENIKVC